MNAVTRGKANVSVFIYFSLVGERVSFDGRLLFPGLLVQSPCHDDGYVRVCLKIVLLYFQTYQREPLLVCKGTAENNVKIKKKQ